MNNIIVCGQEDSGDFQVYHKILFNIFVSFENIFLNIDINKQSINLYFVN